jgi:hypothetical protein
VFDRHLVELNGSKHISVIGQGKRIHPVFSGQFEGLIKSDGSVE